MAYKAQPLTQERLAKAKALLNDMMTYGPIPDRTKFYFADLIAEVERLRRPDETENLKEIIRNLLGWIDETPTWVDEGQLGWVLYADAPGLSDDLRAAKEAVS